MKNIPGCLLTCMLAAGLAAAAETAPDMKKISLPVADMEKTPVYTLEGKTNQPLASITQTTASQGRHSLRFEHTGTGPRRAGISFPVEGAPGCDALAFDIYCEHDLQFSRLNVQLQQEPDGSDQGGVFSGMLKLNRFIDGWTTVQLSAGAGLEFFSAAGAQPDWGRIRRVSFYLHDGRDSRTVFYLDNIRFENVGASRNLLFNGSFELSANPGVPDGWGRDLAAPPFGAAVWGIDAGAAWVGTNALRIGHPGKFARYWLTHLEAKKDQDYTFSIYLKAGAAGTRALLQLNGTPAKMETDVGAGWQRYTLTGKAPAAGYLYPQITLAAGGPLWLDAAQLELGAVATDFMPATLDLLPADEADRLPPADASSAGAATVQAAIRRAAAAPEIDGKLDDPCWNSARELAPFVLLKENCPARRQTAARICFDERGFYLAVRAEEPDMAAFRARLNKLQSGPWGADCIEIFIDLHHDRRTYYHFAANVRGECWQARHTLPKFYTGEPASWQAEWRAAGRMEDNAWTVEAAIPFTCFDLRPELPVGDTFGLNVCRVNLIAGEYSSWAFMPATFHTPAAFGTVAGFDIDLAEYYLEAVNLDWQYGEAGVLFRNRTDSAFEGTGVFFTRDHAGRRVEIAARPVAAPAAGERRLSTPAPIAGDGLRQLFFGARDQSGRERLVSQPVIVQASAGGLMQMDGTEFDFYTTGAVGRARCRVETTGASDLHWSILGDDRRALVEEETPARPGFNEWQFPVGRLETGTYRVRAVLHAGEGVLAEEDSSFRKLPAAPAEVRINQWGRFLVADGAPFLWFGFFDSLQPFEGRWEAALDDMRTAHCTAVLVYTGIDIRSAEKIQQALDTAQQRGLKVWLHLSWIASCVNPKNINHPDRYRSEAEAYTALAEIVNRYKTHPALLGWCTLDEPGNREDVFTREFTERFYRQVKDLDPHHPCIFSHLTRLGESAIYRHATDLALIPFSSQRDARYELLFQEFWQTGLPVAINAPCYGAIHSPRAPTAAELRTRIYKPVILGARGVCLYTYRFASDHNWRELGRLGLELRELSPVLLAPDDRLRVQVAPCPREVLAALKAYAGRYYLLAVNTAQQPREVVFRLTDAPAVSAAEPLFGAPAARVDGPARELATAMPALSTAVYCITP